MQINSVTTIEHPDKDIKIELSKNRCVIYAGYLTAEATGDNIRHSFDNLCERLRFEQSWEIAEILSVIKEELL